MVSGECVGSVNRTRFVTLLFIVGLFACLIGCGSSSAPKSDVPAFSSIPPTAAAQDQAYSYTLAASDPAGGAITFALTSAPVGGHAQREHNFVDPDRRTSAPEQRILRYGNLSRRWNCNPILGCRANWDG
jgi:hypothetical protein